MKGRSDEVIVLAHSNDVRMRVIGVENRVVILRSCRARENHTAQHQRADCDHDEGSSTLPRHRHTPKVLTELLFDAHSVTCRPGVALSGHEKVFATVTADDRDARGLWADDRVRACDG